MQTDTGQLTTGDGTEQAMGVQAGDWLGDVRGARFYGNGKYITGYVDTAAELSKVLDDYQTITGTSFPTIQQLSLATKASEDEYLQQRFLTPSARPRLFWQMHAGEPVIPFDGVPFISVGQGTEVPCVLAGRRKTTTQLLVATGDVLPTKIRTHGCAAKLSIRRILRYPSSRLPDVGAQGITAMRRLRKQVLEVLTAKICAGLVKPCERYYFSLPTPLAHDTHIVPEIEDPPSLIEPIHDEILKQISQGITSISHIHDHIRKFVESTYGNNPSINTQDPTFNPSRYELARYIYWLYKSGRAVDQDCPFKERYNVLNEEDKLVNNTDFSGILGVSDTGDIGNIGLATPQVGAEETTATVTSMSSKGVTSNSIHTSNRISGSSPMLMATPKSSIFNTNDIEQSGNSSSIQQGQEEVRNMLTILENQTFACNNLHALQVLRRQLTSLCTEFSMHLASTPKRVQDGVLPIQLPGTPKRVEDGVLPDDNVKRPRLQ